MRSLASPGAFHTTQWSVVLAAGGIDADTIAAETALADLCGRYWYPIYAFTRRKGHSPEDAKDLTQGFFEHLLEKQTLERAHPEKGRFRSFLLGALKNYISVVHRKEGAAKRGGGVPKISIDEEFGENRYQIEPETQDTPETLYAKSWAQSLLDEVECRLQETYARAGQADLTKALHPYLAGTEDAAPYSATADELGITVSAVTSAVHRYRKAYRELLRSTIAETLSPSEDIDDELRFLITTLQAGA